jgi:hypothetical protein
MRILNSSLVYIVAGLTLGLASALYSLDSFGLKPVDGSPGWQEWRLGADDRLEPYAIGHFLASGKVPTPSSARYFVRSVDDDGGSLRGDCVFVLEGPVTQSRWWSISAGDTEGVSASAVLPAGKAVLESDGQLRLTVARQPMPGNWIRPDDNGTFNLIYVVSEPDKDATIELPHVKKSGC